MKIKPTSLNKSELNPSPDLSANSFGFDDIDQMFEKSGNNSQHKRTSSMNLNKNSSTLVSKQRHLINHAINMEVKNINAFELQLTAFESAVTKCAITSTPEKCISNKNPLHPLKIPQLLINESQNILSPIKHAKTNNASLDSEIDMSMKSLDTHSNSTKQTSPSNDSVSSNINISKLNIGSDESLTNDKKSQKLNKNKLISKSKVSVGIKRDKENLEEIGIFYSPIKKSVNSKPISMDKSQTYMDLFLVDKATLQSDPDLEETVLKPRKVYHTPEQFGKRIKEKKEIHKSHKPKTVTKFDKLAEKINQQFDEFDDYQLNIE